MKKEKEVQVTKKKDVYYCDECGKEMEESDAFHYLHLDSDFESIVLHPECLPLFCLQILALRAEPKE